MSVFNSIFEYIKTRQRDVVLILGFIIAIALLIYLYAQTQPDENWDQFIIEHKCKVIKTHVGGHQRSGWICDDGKEYYRWRQQV